MEAVFYACNDLGQRRFNFYFGLRQQTGDRIFDLLDEFFGVKTRVKCHFRVLWIEIAHSRLQPYRSASSQTCQGNCGSVIPATDRSQVRLSPALPILKYSSSFLLSVDSACSSNASVARVMSFMARCTSPSTSFWQAAILSISLSNPLIRCCKVWNTGQHP